MEKVVLSYMRLSISRKHIVTEDAEGQPRLNRLPSVTHGLEGKMVFSEGTAAPSAILLVVRSEVFGDVAGICITARTIWTGIRFAWVDRSAVGLICLERLKVKVNSITLLVLVSRGSRDNLPDPLSLRSRTVVSIEVVHFSHSRDKDRRKMIRTTGWRKVQL